MAFVVQGGEHLLNVNTYLVVGTAITGQRVVIMGTGGATGASGTTKYGAVRNPISAGTDSGCFAGFARGSAAGSGVWFPMIVQPGYFATGTAQLGSGLGTEIPVGVSIGSAAANTPISIAEIGSIVYVEAGAAVNAGMRLGVSGTHGRVVQV